MARNLGAETEFGLPEVVVVKDGVAVPPGTDGALPVNTDGDAYLAGAYGASANGAGGFSVGSELREVYSTKDTFGIVEDPAKAAGTSGV